MTPLTTTDALDAVNDVLTWAKRRHETARDSEMPRYQRIMELAAALYNAIGDRR